MFSCIGCALHSSRAIHSPGPWYELHALELCVQNNVHNHTQCPVDSPLRK